MTGDKKTGPKPCLMGSSSPNPCPFPATEALPHRFPDRGSHLYVYHAATEPLVDEVDEFGVWPGTPPGLPRGCRGYCCLAASLITVLERAETSFSERRAPSRKCLEDLQAAEHALMQG